MKKLSAIKTRSQLRGNKKFVADTDDPEFCLGTTLLYIDTRNTCHNWFEKTDS